MTYKSFIIIFVFVFLNIQKITASELLNFKELFYAPIVKKGIDNWVSIINKQANESDEWCVIISAITEDRAAITPLARYELSCGIYFKEGNKIAVLPYYSECQSLIDHKNSALHYHGNNILMKNFWKPKKRVRISKLFIESNKLKSLSVGKYMTFGERTKTVLFINIKNRLITIEVKGEWRTQTMEELVNAFGKEVAEIIYKLVQESDLHKEQTLGLMAQLREATR